MRSTSGNGISVARITAPLFDKYYDMSPEQSTFKLPAPILSSLLLLAVSACGGGSSTPSQLGASQSALSLSDALEEKNIKQVGVVQYQKSESTSFFGLDASVSSTIGAQFHRYETPLSSDTLSALISEYSSGTTEYCKVGIGTSTGSNGPSLPHPITLEPYDRVSAGDVLPVTGPQGTLTELHSYGVPQEWVIYDAQTSSSSGSLDNHFPYNASISIPGDVFPAFNNIQIPYIELIKDFGVSNTENVESHSSQVLTESSTITWETSEYSDGYVWIHTYAAINSDGVPTQFLCYVSDDGEYSLPQNVRDAFALADFPSDEMRIWRDRVSYAVEGDALVVVKTSAGPSSAGSFLSIGPTLWDW